MVQTGDGVIQAMELKKGMIGLSSGTYKSIKLISCVEDGTVTVHFPAGDEIVNITAGTDRALAGVDITISSGKFDIN